MFAPVRTSAPSATPVSLAELKVHLRVDSADEDDLIGALLDAATQHLDGWTGVLGRALVTQTWRQDYDGFGPCQRLPLGPVASITSVTYYDAANASQTLATSVYELLTDELGAYVSLKANQVWPTTYSRSAAVSVTFVAGTSASNVPAPIRQAILLLAGHFYANREAVAPGALGVVPMAVDSLIAPYRRIGF